jgi:hypothetical protein
VQVENAHLQWLSVEVRLKKFWNVFNLAGKLLKLKREHGYGVPVLWGAGAGVVGKCSKEILSGTRQKYTQQRWCQPCSTLNLAPALNRLRL